MPLPRLPRSPFRAPSPNPAPGAHRVAFDSQRAWQDANQLMWRNRDVLLALAGVFFLLPALAVALVVPVPPEIDHLKGEALINAITGWYGKALPVLFPLALVQMVGLLGVLVLLLDRQRPTVAAALARAVRLLPRYFAAQVLIALSAMGLGTLVLAVLGAVLSPLVAAVPTTLAMALLVVRTVLVGPILASGSAGGPLTATRASLRVTEGQTFRLAAFLALVLVLFTVVFLTASMAGQSVLGLLLRGSGDATANLAQEVLAAALAAAAVTWWIAILAAIHDQLGGD